MVVVSCSVGGLQKCGGGGGLECSVRVCVW
jgi:hypothetical protein